tara:strand:+ start:52 stop:426 length:375 start_codon:yes stop_codon:yes gene_type:complete
MRIDKKYLKKVWNSVWEEGLSELEVQRRYFTKLDKKLKGEERFYLMSIKRKIEEMEIVVPFEGLLSEMKESKDKAANTLGLQNLRSEGDGTEWLFSTDKNGRVFKRAMGSDERIYKDLNGGDKQ